MRLGGTSRNDSNDFFVVFFMTCMDYEQNGTPPYRSNRYPAFLVLKRGVTLGDRVGIVEHQNSGFKADIVLAKILAVLLLVPIKSHNRCPRARISVTVQLVNIVVRT